MNIILFGQMGSGKDEVSRLLGELYGYKNHKLGFYIRKHVDDLFSHLSPAERRPYYQQYGEILRETFDINLWNNSCLNSMSQEDINNGRIVISDGRQPHEVTFWMEKGFTPVGIDVSLETRLERLNARDGNKFTADSFKHSTEINAANIIAKIKSGEIRGQIINNNEDISHLKQQIHNIICE